MRSVIRRSVSSLRLAPRASQFTEFHASRYIRKDVPIAVPSLGDSITEATVIEWTKSLGDLVQEDDVLVVLETDKVTVDVRSTGSGVLVQQFAAADDEIVVGAPLAMLDDSGTVPAAAAMPATGGSSETTLQTTPGSIDSPSHLASSPARVPMIRFRYGALRAIDSAESQRVPSVPSLSAQAPEIDTGASDASTLPPMYGRPPISAAEAECITIGGW